MVAAPRRPERIGSTCLASGAGLGELDVGRLLGTLGVQAALLLFGTLPPPATGAKVLAGADGARAGGAADRGKALVVQRVVWHVVPADVVPHLRFGPVGQRIDLEERERLVELD